MFFTSIPLLIKKTIFSLAQPNARHCSSNLSPIVTILDASCRLGKNLALLLKQNPLIGELRLYDKNRNICAVAEDLSHIDTKTRVKSFGGRPVLKHAVMDANIVLTIGGCRESMRETPKQTFEKNIDDLRLAALHMIEFNPKGLFCIAKPPIEAMVPLVTEEYKKAGVYDSRKIIGVTNVAVMRANSHIAAETGHDANEVVCPVVGGLSKDCVVAVLSQIRPKGLNVQGPGGLQKRIAHSEDDVLKLCGDGGASGLAAAVAVARFVNALLKASMGETNCVECAFVRQTGHIGQFLPYMTSIVRLGRHGVMSTHMPKVSGEEGHLLKKRSLVIKERIRWGESLVTGETMGSKEATMKNNNKNSARLIL